MNRLAAPAPVVASAITAALATAAAVTAITVVRFVDPPTTAFVERARRARRSTATPAGAGARDVAPDITLDWVPLRHIAAEMQLAAIAGEDVYFPIHRGFDWESLRSARRHNRRIRRDDGTPRGGSTISQQVAKNLFLWPRRSYVRKAIEAVLTALIELSWPKQRILEVYLNVAQFGPTTFGVGNAARRYFGVEPAALTPGQAALLVAVLPNPHRYDVAVPDELVRYRQLLVIASMRKLPDGYLERLAPSRQGGASR